MTSTQMHSYFDTVRVLKFFEVILVINLCTKISYSTISLAIVEPK